MLKLKSWSKAFEQAATEFDPVTLPVISGEVPPRLRGSLYRNGPARLARNGVKVGHWFDGDGAVLAVHFTDTGPFALYRYVQTAGYQEEEAAGEFLFGGYGMMPAGSIWDRFDRGIKNVANTSVLALPDKLLALWEGGYPHALDLQTLRTIGTDTLGGLQGNWTFSAHPKRDPITGNIYNFGVTPGKNAQLFVYMSDRTGKIQKHSTVELDGVPLIHDFVLAGEYLVFFISPVRLQLFSALFHLKSFSDSLVWRPRLGTQVLAIARDRLELVSRSEAEPWFQWHFSNGYQDESGNSIVDLVKYEDFSTNQYLKEVASGRAKTAAKGTLWRVHLHPETGLVTHEEPLVSRGCEFPSVAPQEVGQEARFTYLSLYRQDANIGEELLGAIGRYDHQTGTLTEADFGPNSYPSEPLYIPDPEDPQQGWVITVVFDGTDQGKSEVWIFKSDRLDEDPVCRLGLPKVVPMGFHGTWVARQPGFSFGFSS